MTWFWLRILDILKPLYKWQSIDFDQLRAIVGIKLEMDNRRAASFRAQQTQKEYSNSFGLALFFYTIFGALISMVIASVPSVVFAFTVYHAFLMLMITLMLISDFSSILLDTSDNTIVLPRPVSATTFYAARTTHILLYIGQVGVSLSLVPLVVTFIKYGALVGITTCLTTVLTIVFSVALTNGLYLLLMRFTSEEKLKSIINSFQIGMAIFMMGGYQILPRLFSTEALAQITSSLHWWAVFIPPMWMAGAVKLVYDFGAGQIEMVVTFLAVIIPLVGWKLISKYLAPYFATKLADLGTGSAPIQFKREKKKSILFNFKNWITQPGTERAAFSIVTYSLARDRKLKLRIYPSIGALLILVIVPFLRSKPKDGSLLASLQALGDTHAHLFAIYASIFILTTVMFEIHFADEFKAAWIYFSAPIEKPGEILSGTLKAITVKFFLPIYSVMSIIVLIIWGQKAIVDLVFGGLASFLLLLLISVISDKRLPLSLPLTARNQSGSILRGIVSMIIIGLTAAVHYFLTQLDLLLWIACPFLLLACYFILRMYRKVEWDEVEI